MLASPRTESIREVRKILLVDRIHYLYGRPLDDLVLESRHAQRSLPPAPFGYVRPTHWLRVIRSPLQSMGEVLEIFLEVLCVVPPRLSVHARSRRFLQVEIGVLQHAQVTDVVEQRGESGSLVLPG